MKGHIRERSPGKWAIILDIHDPETGKRKRRWHSFRGTKREAQVECSRLISELRGGSYVDPTRETVGAFLERWLDHMKGQVSPRSHERYTELVRNNIAPPIGGLLIAKLAPAHISGAYAKALINGRLDGKGGLSPATVVYMHRVLREALQQAVVWNVLARNPADAVKPPKVERKPMVVLDTTASVDVIEAARGKSLFVPILLGIFCGLRRGEMTALRWKSIDLDGAQLAVVAATEQTKNGCREKPPKSGKARTVALPALLVEELRQHKVSRRKPFLKLGVRLNGDCYVVAQPDGSPYQPRSLHPRHGAVHERAGQQGPATRYTPQSCDADARQPAFIRRSRANGSAIPRSASHSISTATSCRECRRKRPRALTMPCAGATEARHKRLNG